MQEIIQDIRRKCRLAMNGIASTSMRQRGLAYKINFGLQISQIKELASNYKPDAGLASQLWKEDTRELKILATLLYPIAEFTRDDANKWVSEVSNQEIREQVSLNLFQNLSFAKELAEEWGRSGNQNIRATGYWLLVRLFLTKKITTEVSVETFPSIWDDVISEDTFLRNSASLALKHIGRQSSAIAQNILSKLGVYKNSEDLIRQEAYNSLVFEFEFYFEDDK